MMHVVLLVSYVVRSVEVTKLNFSVGSNYLSCQV